MLSDPSSYAELSVRDSSSVRGRGVQPISHVKDSDLEFFTVTVGVTEA